MGEKIKTLKYFHGYYNTVQLMVNLLVACSNTGKCKVYVRVLGSAMYLPIS
jgi:hypothetical protein